MEDRNFKLFTSFKSVTSFIRICAYDVIKAYINNLNRLNYCVSEKIDILNVVKYTIWLWHK